MRVMVTGANGHLGVRLIRHLAERHDMVAVVRTERAKSSLLSALKGMRLSVPVVDYVNPETIAAAAAGCDVIVHLVGIIKETANNSYVQAHEDASKALIQAADGASVKKIVYLSILGSRPESHNPCLASRARAEAIFLDSPISVLVIRVPMVLGENDFASRALIHKAARAVNLELRAGCLEQPIYAGDVIKALAVGIESELSGLLELAGPECVSRRELIERAGRVKGNQPKVISVPFVLGVALAWLLELIMPDPPVTRAMLGVLDHDDQVDPSPACDRLGIELTPLDDTLKLVSGKATR